MICRDYMIRVCHRKPCKMCHKIIACSNESCNGNRVCKFVHLIEDEIIEINNNIRPFRETVYNEMKRLAFILRESYPAELRVHTCSLYMLGECVWLCLSCGTVSNSKSSLIV